jgi:ribosomal protein L40E
MIDDLQIKPCVKCGARDRKTNGQCRPCATEITNKWYEKNKEKVKTSLTDKYRNDPEKYKTRRSAWVKANSQQDKASQMAWRKTNPAKYLYSSNKSVAKKHGYVHMSLEECEKALNNKVEFCEVCLKQKAKCVDHDHKTGKFRGWLCHKCNQAEGLLGTLENIELLAEYVRKHLTNPNQLECIPEVYF